MSTEKEQIQATEIEVLPPLEEPDEINDAARLLGAEIGKAIDEKSGATIGAEVGGLIHTVIKHLF